MILIKLIIYFILLLVCDCTAFYYKNKFCSKDKICEHCSHASRVQREFIQEMEQKYGCICIGTGGSMPKNIQDISVKFAIRHRATLEETRAMLVLAVERFTEMLNADEGIRPYLCEYPFPSHRAEVSFSFNTPFGVSFADGSMSHSFQTRGKLFYYSEDSATGNSVSLLQEPYEEAKKIAQASPINNPFVHQGKPYESLIDAVFGAYIQKMWAKYRLELERIGGKLTDGVDEVVVRLICFRSMPIDRARELQVIAAEKILEMINGNEQLRPYIKDYPLSIDRLKVAVLFRKPNYYPFFDGNLDYVQQSGDEVSYVSSDDYDHTKFFSEPPPVIVKESYREAAEKVRNSSRGKKLKIKWQTESSNGKMVLLHD